MKALCWHGTNDIRCESVRSFQHQFRRVPSVPAWQLFGVQRSNRNAAIVAGQFDYTTAGLLVTPTLQTVMQAAKPTSACRWRMLRL